MPVRELIDTFQKKRTGPQQSGSRLRSRALGAWLAWSVKSRLWSPRSRTAATARLSRRPAGHFGNRESEATGRCDFGAHARHPASSSPPQVYAAKVARLEEALNDPAIREEANELLRTLIERVELQPGAEGGPMRAVVRGDLAQILEVCENAAGNKKRPAAGAGGVLSVVAGQDFNLRPSGYEPEGQVRAGHCRPSEVHSDLITRHSGRSW